MLEVYRLVYNNNNEYILFIQSDIHNRFSTIGKNNLNSERFFSIEPYKISILKTVNDCISRQVRHALLFELGVHKDLAYMAGVSDKMASGCRYKVGVLIK